MLLCPRGQHGMRLCRSHVLLLCARRYCPTGSSAPAHRVNQSVCQPGWYCVSGVRLPCPDGVYGSDTGLSTPLCSGQCSPGYFCTAGAVVPNQTQCGDVSVYCPLGSSVPQAAPGGVFTNGGDDVTRTMVTACPTGYYCVNGTSRACPVGRFGCATGLSLSDCNGECAAGYYCPLASTSSHALPCGGAAVFCPVGSGLPIAVDIGYYSYGGASAAVQSMQALCPHGSFCVGGVKVGARFPSSLTPIRALTPHVLLLHPLVLAVTFALKLCRVATMTRHRVHQGGTAMLVG